ncbi:MAG: shikimate dehydrogenase family protein [Vampirovibrionales bacterium]
MTPTPFLHLGLLGYPLGHSQSPRIHNRVLQHLGLEGHYSLQPLPPETFTPEVFRGMFAPNQPLAHGANVTIPYKEVVLPWVDALTPAAKAIGAVNTLIPSQNGQHLVGDNTDWLGFWRSLPTPTHQQLHQGEARVCLLGNGGSARAVVYALLTLPQQPIASLHVLVRNPSKAEPFLQWIQHTLQQLKHPAQLEVSTFEAFPEEASKHPPCSLIVNCTPVGMHPVVEASPLSACQLATLCDARTTVVDLIYNPTQTQLLRDAKTLQATPVNGWGMLVHQALATFSVWSGQAVAVEWAMLFETP